MVWYGYIMQAMGVFAIVATYAIIYLHVHAYFTVIATVIKKRLGVFFGLVWVSIGFALLYNIIFNHFWSCLIKPGSPKDLIENEKLRKDLKNRESRKAAKVSIESGDGGSQNPESEDDRFEGL